jgi:muconate cycloisomerase
MKISSIKTFNVGLRLRKPLKNAKMIRKKSSNTIIKIETDEGITGFGEATFTHFFAGETQDSVSNLINKLLSPVLIGEDPRNILLCIAKMNRVIVGNPFAKAAIEMALWDIRGKILGVPVFELLGGWIRKSIPLNSSISYGNPGEMAEQALEHVEAGFRTLKIYCGRETPASDLVRIRKIRETVGEEINLYVEANQGWGFKTVLQLLPYFEEMKILFMEQPISYYLRAELKVIRERSSIPIAIDEGVFTPEDIVMAKVDGVADIINIYVLKSGGVLTARKAITVAESMGLDLFMGSLNELGISSMAAAHLAATIKELPYPCYLVGPMLHEEDILLEPLDIRDGMLHLSDRPGLGIQVDDRKIKEFCV